jgi:hypothetical protein
MENIEAYPLHWPEGWPRSRRPIPSSFGINSDARARDELLEELRRLGARNVILSTNIVLRNDGLPRSNQRRPDDTGVAVYFKLKDRPTCLASDKYNQIRDNMWALKKSVEALRGLERWGVSEFLERAFKGFQQLEPPRSEDPWETLQVARGDFEAAEKSYRDMAKTYHPDSGVCPDGGFLMTKLNESIEQIRKAK